MSAKGVCDVWLDSLPGGYSAAVSQLQGSAHMTRSCCWRSSIAQTRTASRGRHRCGSRLSSAWRGQRFSSACRGYLNPESSRSMSRGALVVRPGIGSALNLPESRSGWRRETCPNDGAGSDSSTCPTDGHEVTTYLVSTRHHYRINRSGSSRTRRLAGGCPSGEEAQRDLTLGARQQRASHLPAWSPPLQADDDALAGCSTLAAGSRLRGGSLGAQRNSGTRVDVARSITAARAAESGI